MIRLIESLPPKEATCAAEIRIYSLFSAYGNSNLAYFWEQSSDKVTALISKMDGAITLCAYEGADIDEILQFISVVGADSVLSNIPLPMDKGERLCQLTLTAKSHGIKDIPTPDYQKTYDIMSTRFDMPPFDVWYVDMCHRVRHGTAYLLNSDSAALCGFISGESLLIVGLCSLPQCKGKGSAAKLLEYALNTLPAKHFTVLAEDKLEQYYVNRTFALTGYHYTYGDV